ncbi:HtaA domain-containing protein [Conexibacter stalactiti]|uniref:HtaA domain-containing protein n=1 Tax=Conexibacter stalactiti TaxID=1940611 RepID=A0ABU4HR28_9ACTN|nr:HtaA domain-containing protein [Conexibacter stalactiti]MDW5595695.1 HtaA domain-containing protein [Conexibacter stalactiti]MEC5036337.1 HtaA domain-containing protein [Conexibacter stalactiti]
MKHPVPPPPRRRTLALSGALLTLLLAPVAASAAELPLDLGAYDATSLTFDGLNSSVGAESADGEGAGSAVAGDCNLDGDGRADLVVGAPYASAPGAPYHGRAYLVFGDSARRAGRYGLPNASVDPPSAGTVEISSAAPEGMVGSVVACADVDGDGLDDAVIGSDLGGMVHVIHGDADLGAHAPISVDALGTDGFTVSGPGFYRTHLAALGDLNDDGKEEFAIGTAEAEPGGVGSGAVAVVAGRDGTDPVDLNTPGNELLTVTGGPGDAVTRVAAVGDLGGGAAGARDGIPDLIVGAPDFDGPGGADSGAAFVVSGAARGTVDVRNWDDPGSDVIFPIWGPRAGATVGATVASAGDANGDGLDDLAIGLGNNARLPAPDGRVRRSAWVVYGRGDGTAVDLGALGDDGYALDGAPLITATDALGTSIAALGDVNGDDRDDLSIGAPGYDPLDGELTGAASTGAAYVVYGRTAAEGSLSLTRMTCEDGARAIGARRITGLGAAVAAGGSFSSGDQHLLVGAATGVTSNGNFVRAIPLADVPRSCSREVEPPAPQIYDEVDWGFRENFRRYVTNGFNPAQPAVPISASRGAICEANPNTVHGGCDPRLKQLGTDPLPTRALRWSLVGASATNGGDATIAAQGRVTFRYPTHFFTLAVSDPWFVIVGDTVSVRARLDLDVDPSFGGGRSTDVRMTLATFGLAEPAQVTPGRVVWRTEPGEINATAAQALANGTFLSAGAQVDPVTITIPRSLGELPDEPTVPGERQPDAPRPPPLVPPRKPVVVPPSIAGSGSGRATLRRAGSVLAATLRCGTAACTVGAPRAVTLKLGRGRRARRVVIAVRAPKQLASGRRGAVALVLDHADLRALAGRTVRLRIPLVLRAGGRRVAKTVTVTISVPRSLGVARGTAPRSKPKGAR